jgi:high-affinity nickel permease
LSVAIVLLIGTVELLQVLAGELNLHGRFFNALAALDFETLAAHIPAKLPPITTHSWLAMSAPFPITCKKYRPLLPS